MAVPKLRFKAEDGSEFPEWEEKRLKEVVDFFDSKRKPIESAQRIPGPYPYYGASGIVDYVKDYIFDEDLILLSEDGANIIDRNYRICFMARGKYWVNNHAHVLKAKPGYNNEFICEQLESLDYAKYNTGSAQPKLNREVCNNLKLRIPSLPEQKIIADFLSTIDSIISSQKEELAAWEQRKKGVMQKLFSQEVRFKADDGSEFPEWEKKRLKEVAEIQRGGSPRPIEKYLTTKSGINWIKIGDAPVNGNRITSVKEKIIPEGLKKSRAVHKGDLLLSNSMSFGRPYILEVDGCIHDGWLVIQDNNICFNKTFLCEYLGADIVVKQYKKMAAGSTVNNLNKDLVGNVLVIIPSLPEQQKIADCLSSIDEVIQKEKEELEKWQELKKGLLQQMFV